VRPKRAQLLDARLLPEALAREALNASETISSMIVSVVGAGLAGLMAGWYLHQCGVQVAVFESSDRVGGRVRTDRDLISGKTVEAGAELIGVNHPRWFSLAEAFGLRLVAISTEEDYDRAGLELRLRLGDHDLSEDEAKQVHAELQPVINAIGRDAAPVKGVKTPIRRSDVDSAVTGSLLRPRSGFASA
jgi:monoamine oxidase